MKNIFFQENNYLLLFVSTRCYCKKSVTKLGFSSSLNTEGIEWNEYSLFWKTFSGDYYLDYNFFLLHVIIFLNNFTLSTYHSHLARPFHYISPHHLYLIKGASPKPQIRPLHNPSTTVRDILLLVKLMAYFDK